MGQRSNLFIEMPHSISLPDWEAERQAFFDKAFFHQLLRAAPWLREEMAEQPDPEPELPNAEMYPVLAAAGFIFAEAIDLGPVTRPACACPTCGRLTERVEALT